MNDFILQITQTQATPQTKAMSGRNRPQSQGEGDFSSYISKASERRDDSVSAPRGKKPEEIKPAEELVAYAAASQNANNPAPVENNNEPAAETEAIQSTEPVTTQDVLASALGADDAAVILEMFGIDASRPVLSSEDPTEFLKGLLALMEARLAAASADESVPSDVQSQFAAAYNERMDTVKDILARITEQPAVTVQTVEIIETEIITVAQNAANTDVNTDTDTGPEIELPLDKHDVSALEHIRSKLAAHIAAQSEEGEVEIPAEVQTADTDVKPVLERETAEPEKTVETDEIKTETKKTDVSVHENPGAVSTPVRAAENSVPEIQADVKVNTADIINQIVQSARMSKADGTSQLEIQLRPEHLGKVSIVLTSGEDGVTAHIKAHNDTVRAMLGGGLGELMTSLKEMGINMKNIDIAKPEMNWDYTRNPGQQQFERDNRGNQDGQKQQSRVIRINNPRIAQVSSTLYESAALAPSVGINASVDFSA